MIVYNSNKLNKSNIEILSNTIKRDLHNERQSHELEGVADKYQISKR